MEEFIKAIIEEYKKTGHINIYIVGKEGLGKTTLLLQIYDRLFKELGLKPNLDKLDFNKDILSHNGINLIESFKDSDLYNYKVKLLIRYKNGEFKRGFCEYSIKGKKFIDKFHNTNKFYNEYLEKRKEFIEKSYNKMVIKKYKKSEFPNSELQEEIYEFWKVRGYEEVYGMLGNNLTTFQSKAKYGKCVDYQYLEQFWFKARNQRDDEWLQLLKDNGFNTDEFERNMGIK